MEIAEYEDFITEIGHDTKIGKFLRKGDSDTFLFKETFIGFLQETTPSRSLSQFKSKPLGFDQNEARPITFSTKECRTSEERWLERQVMLKSVVDRLHELEKFQAPLGLVENQIKERVFPEMMTNDVMTKIGFTTASIMDGFTTTFREFQETPLKDQAYGMKTTQDNWRDCTRQELNDLIKGKFCHGQVHH